MELWDGLEQLRRQLQNLPVEPRFAIADSVLYNFAIDVFEQGEAARVVSTLKAPRPAITNARSAFESAIDAQFLVSSEAEYAIRGCRARVYELMEIERIGRQADVFAGRLPGATEQLENTIREEARAWDEASPGRGQVLLGVFEEFQRDRARRKHWSGFSRPEIHRTISGSGPAADEFVRQLGVVYSALSMETHPGPRTGQRPTTMIGPNHLLYRADPEKGGQAKSAAALAVELATGAVRQRRTF